MLQPSLFNTYLVFPILNILLLFYKLFLIVKLPGAFGFAIISLTCFVRLILNPFFNQQLQTAKKMADLKPQLDKLSAKHKKDPKMLQAEQMKLYQKAGINPAAGCLFMIIQIPIFIALYNTLSLFLLNGHTGKIITDINRVAYSTFLKVESINPWFLGFNLALSPAKSGAWYYYFIPVLTALLQYLQVQVSTPAPVTNEPKKDEKKSALSKGEVKKADDNTGDFQKAMNTQMKYIFPLMIGWFSYSLPVGLSVYWNIFSLFSIIQYKKMNPTAKLLDLSKFIKL